MNIQVRSMVPVIDPSHSSPSDMVAPPRLGLQFVQASITQLTQNLQGVQPMEATVVVEMAAVFG